MCILVALKAHLVFLSRRRTRSTLPLSALSQECPLKSCSTRPARSGSPALLIPLLGKQIIFRRESMKKLYRVARRMQRGPKPRLFLRKAIDQEPVLALFSQCILDHFGCSSEANVQLDHSVDENRYILTLASETAPNTTLLTHAPLCPIRRLSDPERRQLDAEMTRIGRYPGVAASAVIESSDGHVLLTRRAKTLRSFPGVWVGPGGYVDPGETTLTTVLRETDEETGLDLTKIEHEISILNLWESAFPPIPVDTESGYLPKRHDIVVYYHIRLTSPAKDMMDFRISQEEVDMVCWVPKPAIHSIAYSVPGADPLATLETLLWEDGKKELGPSTVPLSDLISKDNVSAGTKFALRRMLEKNPLIK